MYNAIVRIYQDIFDHIDTILDNGLPVFNTRAIFNDQITRMKNGQGVSYWMPAVFVEIQTYNEGSIGDQLTFADLDIIFHIAHNELDSGTGTLDQNINVFTMRNYIKSEFSMFKATNCGLFNWKTEQQQFNHDNIYEYKVIYKCHYIDNVASPLITGNQYEYSGASMSIFIEFDNYGDVESVDDGFGIIINPG